MKDSKDGRRSRHPIPAPAMWFFLSAMMMANDGGESSSSSLTSTTKGLCSALSPSISRSISRPSSQHGRSSNRHNRRKKKSKSSSWSASVRPAATFCHEQDRRDFIVDNSVTGAAAASIPFVALASVEASTDPASASNLPKPTGADLSSTGTVETLDPINGLLESLYSIKRSLLGKNSALASPLSIPTDEKSFKRIFDAYSDPVSYKQQFMDKNAFLVYYTQGKLVCAAGVSCSTMS